MVLINICFVIGKSFIIKISLLAYHLQLSADEARVATGPAKSIKL